MEKQATKKRPFYRSLTFNVILSIAVILLAFQVIASTIGYLEFTNALSDEYNESAFRTANMAKSFIDGNDISVFLAAKESILAGDDTETVRKYNSIKKELDDLCDTQDVNVIYVIVLNPGYDSFVSVFNSPNKNSGYTAWDIGHVEDANVIEDNAFYGVYKDIYENGLERGSVIRTNNLNGVVPHVTSLIPVKAGGQIAAILCVQRTIAELTDIRGRYIRLIVLTAVILLVVSTALSLLHIRWQFVKPVKEIADEAARFAAESSAPEKPISETDIKINELSELARAINDMERDTLKHIEDLSAVISEKQRMGTELRIASLIQEGSVPTTFPPFPDRREFQLFASMTPAKEIGGDFYDFFFIDKDHLALVMADVSGKGIPAALFMMITKILISDRALMGGTPSEILTFVNSRICENNKAEMFVTVWLGILDVNTGVITASNAGHDDPAVYRKNGKFDILKSKHGLVVGAMKEAKYRDFEIKLERGDKIFLYTDGVPEATNAEQKMLTIDGMLAVLNKATDLDPEGVLAAVKEGVDAFVSDSPQFDDLTMLCLKYEGPQEDIEEEDMEKLTIQATDENLEKARDFVRDFMERAGCSPKSIMQAEIAVEEIFVNVAHYAYAPDVGDVELKLKTSGGAILLTFTDCGVKYNPLEKENPDVTLSADDREIGGLGIFMVKKLVDNMTYEYKDGKNILILEKKI